MRFSISGIAKRSMKMIKLIIVWHPKAFNQSPALSRVYRLNRKNTARCGLEMKVETSEIDFLPKFAWLDAPVA